MEKLSWNEPKEYRRSKFNKTEKDSPLRALGFAGFAFLTLIGIRLVVGINPRPDQHPPSWSVVVPICLVVSLFIAYVWPRVVGRATVTIVIFSNKGVNVNSMGTHMTIRFTPWEQIGACEFDQVTLGDRRFNILRIYDHEGEEIREVALDKTVSIQEIKGYLSAQSVKVI